MSNDIESKRELDSTIFWATIAVVTATAVPILSAPDKARSAITHLYDLVTSNFGILYIWYAVAVILFLAFLAFSKYGSVRLGEIDSQPEFSTFSWVGMLFCAGIGAGMLYWATIEWGFYIDNPPFGVAPRSTNAIEWAASYGIFHWGITGWAIYCLPTLAIAYPFYVRRVPYLRLSTACSQFLVGGVNSKSGRVIDFIFMVNLIGGTGTSLGLSTPMISAGIAKLTGLSASFVLDFCVMTFCVVLFSCSAWIGLKKGIQRLSELNMVIALALLAFVLLVGPTLFILKMGTNSIGLVLQNFIRMNTWTDPWINSGFVESWTIFYWAWWVAFAPFVGIFVTRISFGRTLRQVIFGMLGFGSMGVGIFFIVLGNYAMHLELNDILNVTNIMREQSESAAITEVFMSLPFGYYCLAAFCLISVVFVVTTYDSASYTLASVATQRLRAGEDPARWQRLFWAGVLAVLPISLMYIDGGQKIILSATIVFSLPLLAVGIIMCVSLMRALREDDQHREIKAET